LPPGQFGASSAKAAAVKQAVPIAAIRISFAVLSIVILQG
jgi:hypothetical protein